MPAAADLQDYGNVGGNSYDKYGSRNPIARLLMNGFLDAFDASVARAAPGHVFEIGCGEGHLSLRLLGRGIDASGMDVEAEVVAEANAASRAAGHGERFAVRSVYDLAPGEIAADLILCCEVLEHLPDPDRALQAIAAQDAGWFLFSVPREPLWRALNMARGKYLRRLGNTPGHIQHWSRRGFREMIGRRFDIVEMRSPLPWSMALCRRR
ncbi:MAG: class I SAM-dependent methyltransferase [Allosphingosinicella sp.]|uniref:class I SAM-dependent methyltransferase n=1 Tax=Allosphingosinicella sp. TaxID=2823234 RepID=UPI0039279DDB